MYNIRENQKFIDMELRCASDTIKTKGTLINTAVDDDGVVRVNGIKADNAFRSVCRWMKIPFSFFSNQNAELKRRIIDDCVDKTSIYHIIGSSDQLRLIHPVEKPYFPLEKIKSLCEEFVETFKWVGGVRINSDFMIRYNADIFFYSSESIVDDDDIRFGVHMNLSEVCARNINIYFGLFRLMCDNGLFIDVDGGSLGEFLISEVNPAIPVGSYFSFLDEEILFRGIKTFEKFYNKVKMVTGDQDYMIEVVKYGKRIGLIPRRVSDLVISSLTANPRIYSFWDVLNMITDNAKKIKGVLFRTELNASKLFLEWESAVNRKV